MGEVAELLEGQKKQGKTIGLDSQFYPVKIVNVEVPKEYTVGRSIRNGSRNK
jgi:hypothetical protein